MRVMSSTVIIHGEEIKDGEFQTLFDFLMSVDIATIVDLREEPEETLPPEVKASWEEVEKEGIEDCVDL